MQSDCARIVTDIGSSEAAGVAEVGDAGKGVRGIEFVSEAVTVIGISITRVTSWVTITVANCVTWMVWMTGFPVEIGPETAQALPKKMVSKPIVSDWMISLKTMVVFMGLR